jgi:hypothetical protein
MEINVDQLYFLMSFRFDKTDPEEYGLISSSEQDNLFIRTSDGSTWKKKNLYDFGWGNENGFIRQPELDFDELWYLLLNSKAQENEYGAASELLEKYPEELLMRVEQILDQNAATRLDEKAKRVCLILKLDRPLNRSKTIGKPYEQISREFERWRAVSEKVAAFTNSRPAIQPTTFEKSEMNEKDVVRTNLRREKRPWWRFW